MKAYLIFLIFLIHSTQSLANAHDNVFSKRIGILAASLIWGECKGWLSIKESSISGAGNGVFAERLIKKGTMLGRLRGERAKILDEKHIAYAFPLYTKKKNGNKWIVPSKTLKKNSWHFLMNTGSFFYPENSHHETRYRKNFEEKNNNVVCYYKHNNIWFKALRDIHPGKELLWDYGSKYCKNEIE